MSDERVVFPLAPYLALLSAGLLVVSTFDEGNRKETEKPAPQRIEVPYGFQKYIVLNEGGDLTQETAATTTGDLGYFIDVQRTTRSPIRRIAFDCPRSELEALEDLVEVGKDIWLGKLHGAPGQVYAAKCHRAAFMPNYAVREEFPVIVKP